MEVELLFKETDNYKYLLKCEKKLSKNKYLSEHLENLQNG